MHCIPRCSIIASWNDYMVGKPVMHKILTAVDGSSASEKGAMNATPLAELTNAELLFTHVLEDMKMDGAIKKQLTDYSIRSSANFKSEISFVTASLSTGSVAYFNSFSHASSCADRKSFLSMHRPCDSSLNR